MRKSLPPEGSLYNQSVLSKASLVRARIRTLWPAWAEWSACATLRARRMTCYAPMDHRRVVNRFVGSPR